MPKGHRHARIHGWYRFPIDFDPIWMLAQCPAWSDTADPTKVRSKWPALIEALGLLR